LSIQRHELDSEGCIRTRTPSGSSSSSNAAAPSAFTDLKRRRFLLSLGAGGATAAAATVAALPGVEVEAETSPDAGSAGYRETSHVRDYYRTIRI
jgi:hypothetical protein